MTFLSSKGFHWKYFLAQLLSSFLIAYSAYVWLIQTPYFFSRFRLALGFLGWAMIFFPIQLVWPRLMDDLRRDRLKFLTGAGAFFVLFHLFAAVWSPKIAYTYLFLPTQRVTIRPLSAGAGIEIRSFTVENGGEQGIHQFTRADGWQFNAGNIVFAGGNPEDLIWVGKPGQSVQIHFNTCPGCGKVEIRAGSDRNMVDLNLPKSDLGLTVQHPFPSLLPHRIVNLFLLELAGLLSAAFLWMILNRMLVEIGKLSLRLSLPRWLVQSRSTDFLAYGVLAFLTLANYGIRLQPVLYNDDWCQIVYSANARLLQPLMLHERRPLHLFFAAVFNSFLPLDQMVVALYITQIATLLFTALLTYQLVRELAAGSQSFALLCAALWLIFPNDYTLVYISMLPARFAYLLMMAVMLFVVRFFRDGSKTAGVLAVMMLMLSLLMYEGQFGLAAVSPLVFMGLFWRKLSWKHWAGVAALYVTLIGFTAWRVLIQPAFYQDAKLESLNIQVGEIILRWLEASKTVLGGFQFPHRGNDWLTLGSAWNIAFVCLGLVFLICVYTALTRQEAPVKGMNAVRNYGIFFGLGVIFWAAGYFPILLNYPVNIYSHLSRVNIFSNLGSVVMLLSLIHLISGSVRSRQTAPGLNLALALPLLAFGSIVQLQVQEANRQSWTETKEFLRVFLDEVPDLEKETQLFVNITVGPLADTFRRPLFTSDWEASCAFQTLYDVDESELMIGYRYNDLYVPPFPGYGVIGGALITDSTGDVLDPAKLIVLDYDIATQDLTIAQNLDDFMGEDSENYRPEERILDIQRSISTRKLIEP